jgi:hypothetical protein
MADTEFHHLERVSLLTALKNALNDDNVPSVPSTVWSYLWLSDIDRLRALAQNPQFVHLLLIGGAEKDISHSVDLLTLYRDPTISPSVYSAANTFTTSNSTASISTASINFSTKGNYTEFIDFQWS